MSMKAQAARAIRAMTDIGIPVIRVRKVLKELLKVYDNNWELIEDENYRVLADAIFDNQDDEAEKEVKETKADHLNDESTTERPLKRLRLRYQDDQGSSGKKTLEENGLPEDCHEEERKESFQRVTRSRCAAYESSPPQMHHNNKQKEPASSQSSPRMEVEEISALIIRDTKPDRQPVSPLKNLRDKGKEPVLSSQSLPRHTAVDQPQLHLTNSGVESDSIGGKGKEPMSPYMVRKEKSVAVKSNSGVYLKEPKVEPGILLLPKQKLHNPKKTDALIKPKSEPFNDGSSQIEVPIAIMPPPDPGHTSNKALSDQAHKEGYSTKNYSIQQPMDLPPSPRLDKDDDGSDAAGKPGTSLQLANPQESSPANFEIASSPMGEVRLSLSCNYASDQAEFHIPSLDAVLKAVEDKCLKSYKILEPNFSLAKLMQEMCQCFLDLSTDTTDSNQEKLVRLTHNLDFLKKANLQDALGAIGNHQVNFQIPISSLNGSLDVSPCTEVVVPGTPTPGPLPLNGNNGIQYTDPPDCSLSLVPQQDSSPDSARQIHDVNDITKGEEKVRISFINEVSSASFPSRFHYIPRNIVYQNAYVNFSLARIGDEDCCSDCFGDCLSSSIPCECARETGGEFAYTLDGLVQEKLLDQCISMNRDPQHHQHYYCQVCPLERNKSEDSPGKCKGHLVRKFIKECWSKCGCSKQCGNRVVQRGITCKLQVFFSSEGKGWGLRTLEDLPRGTFVCEYVGEILTNIELHERNMQSTGNEEHTYPVLLDADWGSEGVLKDEEALCLDATCYGNVARFINHRCFDANLVEIPVEVETPDHHYYHLAFFTTRKVEAWEELTWDYGIDFDDHTHPVKAFSCKCGSKCCRDMKRSRRSKSKALAWK